VLLEHHGDVVTKEEILGKVWPDTFVEEATLAQNVFTLRKILGVSDNNRPYIETVPRRGYRFTANVILTKHKDAETMSETQTNGPSFPPTTANTSDVLTLAALPLSYTSDDPQAEYLGDGITEIIINNLSQIPRLRVMARGTISRYKGHEVDPQQAGRELNVQSVFTGRVLKIDDSLVIRAELLDVATGWQLWGEQFNHSTGDIFEVQEEIAQEISRKLIFKLTGEDLKTLSRHYTENSEAYQLYLKGRYHWNQRTEKNYEEALTYFQQAIVSDPDFALAYTGLADTYISLDFYGLVPPSEIMPKAKAATIKALEIDDTLSEAYASLGCVNLLYDRDWPGAEKAFLKSLKLNPKYVYARSWYSLYLLAAGQPEKSLAEIKLALELDPYDLHTNQHLGWHYLYARQYDQAIEQLQKTLDLNQQFHFTHALLGRAYGEKGDFPKAISELKKACTLEDNMTALGFLGHAYAVSGKRDEALKILSELREKSKQTYVPPYSIGLIYTALEDKDGAFEWMEKACLAGNEWVNWILISPLINSLRSDPRFEDTLELL
jgi:TolB-like protein/Tfp pilus assembly protein PilF